jgi:hypothetical protein
LTVAEVFVRCRECSFFSKSEQIQKRVEVTHWDSHFAGTLTNARLVEVTLGPNFVTTPVYNGETWCISSYSFNTAIDWD